MADTEHQPYMPHVAFKMDEFRASARNLRAHAAKSIAQAEIWEQAADAIESALNADKRNAQGKPGDDHG